MPKINDTQLILRSTASQHPQGSFYPLLDTLADASDRAAQAIAALVNFGLPEERATRHPASVHRTDGDSRYGLFITPAGTAALGH